MLLRFALVLGLSMVSASAAFAVEPKPGVDRNQVKEDFKQANTFYNLGRFLEAAKLYESVYERYPDNALLYNIAQSYRLGNDAERAVFFYKSFLRNEPKTPRRAEVNARIADLNAVLKAQSSAIARGSSIPVQPQALRSEPSLPSEPVASAEPKPTRPPPADTKVAPLDEPTRSEPPKSEPPKAEPTKAEPTEPAEPKLAASTDKPATSDGAKTPIYKKWWLWTIVGAVVVVGVGVGVGVALSSGPSFKENFAEIGPGKALVQF